MRDGSVWAEDRYGFLESCNDLDGMARLNQDEIGHIGNNCRRHALVFEVS